MTDIRENKEVCLTFFRHVGKREFDAAMNCLDDNVVWWVLGDSVVSGFHRGREAVGKLFAPLAALASDLEIEFGNLTAEEDRVSLEMKSRGELGSGAIYANVYHFLLTVRNGKIVASNEYFDTVALNNLLNP